MEANWIWNHPQWPRFQWDMGTLAEPLGAARRAQGRLEMLSGLLDPNLTREALAEVMKVEGVSTSAIEGEKLNPASVAASVARHLGLPWDPDVPLDRSADGLVSVMHDAVQGYKGTLTITKLCEWQSGLFPGGWSGLSRVTAGELRPGEVIVASGPMGREIVHFEGVSRAHLESALKTFVDWFNSSKGQMDGLIRAGTAHLWFVTLHPFDDGNGRITRALTDMAIAQDESRSDGLFRMSSRILSVRNDYYDALQRAQRFHSGMDATPWLKWFLTQVSEACKESERIIQRTLAKAKFWAFHRDAALNERQRKVLNRMLDAGPSGIEGGMNARKYGSIAHSSKPTSSRDLAELLEHGCIVHVGGGGRSTAYDIPWAELLA